MEQRKDLLSIGGFASATQLSIKALRLYDQLGLLSPRYTDPASGYRYYHADQLHPARLIRAMRDMEMPLALVRQVLEATPAAAENLADEFLHTREKRLAQVRKLLPELTRLLRQEANMSLQVNVKTLEPQSVLSVTQRTKVDKLDGLIEETVERLKSLVREQGGTPAGAPFGIYHGAINEQDDGPIEICLPVSGPVHVEGDVSVRKLGGGKAAAVLLNGEQCQFPAVLKGYDATCDWIRDNGYKVAQSPREVWLGEEGAGMQIEVVWPFKQ